MKPSLYILTNQLASCMRQSVEVFQMKMFSTASESGVGSVYEEIPNAAAGSYEMQANNCYTYPKSSKSENKEEKTNGESKTAKSSCFVITMAIVVVVLFTAICTCCVVAFVEISELKAEVDSLMSCLKDSITECEEFQGISNTTAAAGGMTIHADGI